MKEIQIKSYDICKPTELADMAKTLKYHIVKHKLYVDVGGGKNYVYVEGWQFAGGLIGVVAQVVNVEDVSKQTAKGTEIRWKAEVELRHLATDKVIGRAFAICSSKEDERKKKGRDEFAIMSMAQTRAVGKAYRLVLGWVMKLAGYEATPAEEIKEDMVVEEEVVTDFEKVKTAIEKTKAKTVLQKQKKAIEDGSVNVTDEEKKKLISMIEKKLK